MFLATTADQRFWKKGERILFLGEWCKMFNQKSIWSKLDYKILPYHWQSREKYYQDYVYLNQLYESWLPTLAKNLNALHGENYSDRYWRIILGPWLYYFIQTFYDRYLSIRQAVDSKKVILTWIPPLKEASFTPKDFSTFGKWQSQDAYNLYLYSWLIKAMNRIPVEVKNHSIQPEQIPLRTNVELRDRMKSRMKQIMNIYSRFLPQRHADVVLVSLYIRKRDLIRLQLALGQFPNLYTPEVVPLEAAPHLELRNKLKIPVGSDEFTSLLSRVIVSQIPKSYLENYLELKEKAKKTFPKSSKVIVSVNAHHGNEGFKIWCADQVENRTKLIGTQHGGHYGNARWSSNETHEIKVADQYFSWGWGDRKTSSVTPLSSVQLAGTKKRIRFNPQGGILWLGMSRPRYFSWMLSCAMGCEMLEYIDDQKIFLRSLGSEVNDILKMRLFHTDFGWEVKERLSEAIPGLCFNTNGMTMYQQLCKSRLCIGTYNSTTNLETISANFPTIAFWNFGHWELRHSATPYFEDLVRVGIFHDNPESAARKVNEVYQDPMSWWLSSEIQEARQKFCHRFARTSPTWLSDWKKELFRIAEK